jgi:hypothetical protein
LRRDVPLVNAPWSMQCDDAQIAMRRSFAAEDLQPAAASDADQLEFSRAVKAFLCPRPVS